MKNPSTGSLRSRLRAVLLAAVVAVWGLLLAAGDRRLPFDDLRWVKGDPQVRLGGRWFALRSVDGVPVPRLVEAAVLRWGPGYQDRFGSGLAGLLAAEGSPPGLTCELGLLSLPGGQREERRAFSSPLRWRRHVARLDRRRTARRPGGNVLPPAFRPLVSRIDGRNGAGSTWLRAEEAAQDLASLEWYLDHRFAYLDSSGVDPRAALDGIAADLGEGISRRDFALQVARLLALFGDGHTRVLFGESGIELPDAELPCLFVEAGGRVACLRPDGKGFLDPAFPILNRLGGEPVERLVELVGALFPRAPEAAFRSRSLRWLRRIALADSLAGIPPRSTIDLELLSEDGTRRTVRRLRTVRPRVEGSYALPFEWHVLPQRIGYLDLRTGLFPGEDFRREISFAMQALKWTRGLILDLRGNPGGSRNALPTLLAFFPPAHSCQVVNVAALRMDEAVRPPAPVELLRQRLLFSASSKRWSAAQRACLESIQARFRPEIPIPRERFSEPHFMLLRRAREESAGLYDRPVAVLQDERSASAADVLLAALKGRPTVTLLGTRSAGGSGYPLRYRLPRSGIRLQISAMASFHPDGRLYTGTEPDIPYMRTLADLRREMYERADPLRERAVAFILSRSAARRPSLE